MNFTKISVKLSGDSWVICMQLIKSHLWQSPVRIPHPIHRTGTCLVKHVILGLHDEGVLGANVWGVHKLKDLANTLGFAGDTSNPACSNLKDPSQIPKWLYNEPYICTKIKHLPIWLLNCHLYLLPWFISMPFEDVTPVVFRCIFPSLHDPHFPGDKTRHLWLPCPPCFFLDINHCGLDWSRWICNTFQSKIFKNQEFDVLQWMESTPSNNIIHHPASNTTHTHKKKQKKTNKPAPPTFRNQLLQIHQNNVLL